MSKMLEVLPAARDTMSPYAPRILTVHINPEKIGQLIGPGGKTIRALQEQFDVKSISKKTAPSTSPAKARPPMPPRTRSPA